MSTQGSRIKKRSIVITGHKTSISLEDVFYKALGEIADAKVCTLSALVEEIEYAHTGINLSSAIRVYILAWFRNPPEQARRDIAA